VLEFVFEPLKSFCQRIFIVVFSVSRLFVCGVFGMGRILEFVGGMQMVLSGEMVSSPCST